MRFQKRFIATALLFGLSLGMVPPYPHEGDGIIFVTSSLIYFALSLATTNIKFRRFWFHFGIATTSSMLISMFWFNELAMMHGVWFPPDYFPIIQQFYRVDGEAGYDAHISNTFFILWVTSTLVLAVYHLTSQGSNTPSAQDKH